MRTGRGWTHCPRRAHVIPCRTHKDYALSARSCFDRTRPTSLHSAMRLWRILGVIKQGLSRNVHIFARLSNEVVAHTSHPTFQFILWFSHFQRPVTDLGNGQLLSQIQVLTARITQVCQDICDIKLKCILVTCSDKESNDITANILTNQSDCKDTWDSDRSKPGTLDKHEGCAEGGTNYVYNTPNRHELGNQDILHIMIHISLYGRQCHGMTFLDLSSYQFTHSFHHFWTNSSSFPLLSLCQA